MNCCLVFFLQTFCSACANLTQPSLLFHITCYGCSRSWAKQTTTEPNKNIYTQLVILQGSGTNRHRTVGAFCHTVREKLRSMTADVIWNCVHLDSVGANNPPMGLAFDRRGNQERRGGRREGGSCTQHHRTRSQRRGREGPDHSFTFLLHFYFRHWKRKQKKSAKKGEKGYHESTTRYKEKN